MNALTTAPATFFTVCKACGAKSYDEPNRRHITARVGSPFVGFGQRAVCLDVVVPESTIGFTSFPGDVDKVLDATVARLESAGEGGVTFGGGR